MPELEPVYELLSLATFIALIRPRGGSVSRLVNAEGRGKEDFMLRAMSLKSVVDHHR